MRVTIPPPVMAGIRCLLVSSTELLPPVDTVGEMVERLVREGAPLLGASEGSRLELRPPLPLVGCNLVRSQPIGSLSQLVATSDTDIFGVTVTRRGDAHLVQGAVRAWTSRDAVHPMTYSYEYSGGSSAYYMWAFVRTGHTFELQTWREEYGWSGTVTLAMRPGDEVPASVLDVFSTPPGQPEPRIVEEGGRRRALDDAYLIVYHQAGFESPQEAFDALVAKLPPGLAGREGERPDSRLRP